jgi:hypothetical protein
MSRSIFREATQYSGPENRLTQALAVTLRRVPEAARILALAWTDPNMAGAASREVACDSTAALHNLLREGVSLQSAQTQVRTLSGRQVDLELRFGRAPQPSAEDLVIWIESKLAADPGDRQVLSYTEDIKDVGAECTVVVLAPRESLSYGPEDVPEDVPQRSWQASGRWLEHMARATVESDVIERFLLEELIAYMREDNLVDPRAVGPELLLALAYADQAEAALKRLCEDVSARLTNHYKEPSSVAEWYGKPTYGWNYWEAWDLRLGSDGEADLWLDWNAKKAPAHEKSEGRSLFFMSGLAAKDAESLSATPGDRIQRLLAGVDVEGRHVRFERASDECERITRIALPEEVLVGRILEDQADSLARWIRETFKAIEAVGLTPT